MNWTPMLAWGDWDPCRGPHIARAWRAMVGSLLAEGRLRLLDLQIDCKRGGGLTFVAAERYVIGEAVQRGALMFDGEFYSLAPAFRKWLKTGPNTPDRPYDPSRRESKLLEKARRPREFRRREIGWDPTRGTLE